MKIAILDKTDNSIKNKLIEKLKPLNIEFTINSYDNEDDLIIKSKTENTYNFIFFEDTYNNPQVFNYLSLLRNTDDSFKLIGVFSDESRVFSYIKYDLFRAIRTDNLESDFSECFSAILKDYEEKKLITLNTKIGKISFKASEIQYFNYSQSTRKVEVITDSGHFFLKNPTLKSVFSEIDNPLFIYVYKGTIVNVQNIKAIEKDRIIMKNNDLLFISRRNLVKTRNSFFRYNNNARNTSK